MTGAAVSVTEYVYLQDTGDCNAATRLAVSVNTGSGCQR